MGYVTGGLGNNKKKGGQNSNESSEKRIYYETVIQSETIITDCVALLALCIPSHSLPSELSCHTRLANFGSHEFSLLSLFNHRVNYTWSSPFCSRQLVFDPRPIPVPRCLHGPLHHGMEQTICLKAQRAFHPAPAISVLCRTRNY
jgi:hypothetical protein